MKARRLGHVYCPTGEWTHASTPTHQYLGGDHYRLYYGSRDRQNRTHIFSLDLDMNRPTKPENIRGPLIGPGRKGTFDDCGVSPSCSHGGYLYYLGWSLTKTAPFHNAIGKLVIEGDSLIRFNEGPFIDRTSQNPVSLAYPWVTDCDIYYSSNNGWGEKDSDMAFVLKVESRGYLGRVEDVLPLLNGELAIVRPTVIQRGDYARMLFAVKRDKYSIGTARSKDGVNWTRDKMDLQFDSLGDFDSEEQTYPCVFQHNDKTYMLYNGNGYGRTGFGIAVIE